MKEIFDRLDFQDFLASVCPGLILLAGLAFVFMGPFSAEQLKAFESVLFGALTLLLSFLLGILLNVIVAWGTLFRDRSRAEYNSLQASGEQVSIRVQVRRLAAWLFFQSPRPADHWAPTILSVNDLATRLLANPAALDGVVFADQLDSLVRALAGRDHKPFLPLLQRAERLAARRRFVESTALGLTILTGALLTRSAWVAGGAWRYHWAHCQGLACWTSPWPALAVKMLFTATGLSLLVLLLRKATGELANLELINADFLLAENERAKPAPRAPSYRLESTSRAGVRLARD